MPGCATHIYSHEFDAALGRLPAQVRALLLTKITEMGGRLESFPHYRMTGRSEFRLHVGDYRIIYRFDIARNEIQLITLGHRRDIYR
jgi:mRNA-degrading endonuclease RelE of RelBE toxin-antitoxin system